MKKSRLSGSNGSFADEIRGQREALRRNPRSFMKCIIRLFSIRFLESVPELGPYELAGICGIGGNGPVYTVIDRRDNRQYALKLPYLSYYMMELFYLHARHIGEPPFEKFEEIIEKLSQLSFDIELREGCPPLSFHSPSEERAYQREYLSMKAVEGCEMMACLCDYGHFDLFSFFSGRLISLWTIPYFVIPFFHGIPLSSFSGTDIPLERKWQRSLDIIDHVIDQVEQLHTRGVIHRDMHPGNFLYDEERGELALIDFGAALVNGDNRFDTSGEKRGSVRFMSPEQFSDPCRVDERSDYFFIGGLLLYLLTSRTPFLKDQREKESRPLPAEEYFQKPDGISEKLYHRTLDFLNHLLCFEREKRFQSIGEIRSAWEQVRAEAALRGIADAGSIS